LGCRPKTEIIATRAAERSTHGIKPFKINNKAAQFKVFSKMTVIRRSNAVLGTHCLGTAMSKSDHSLTLSRPKRAAMLACVLLATSLLFGANSALAQDGKSPDTESVLASSQPKRELKQCIECHEAYFAIADGKHFVQGDPRTPKGAGEECKACHGDTSAHNRTPRVKGLVPITYGSKAPPGPQNEQCLTCHQSGLRIHWQGSAHDRSKQACASCHKAHAARDPVMIPETQPAVCFECHKERRAEMLKISTHAIKNGFFSCSNCHQPHGSTARASLQKDTVNQTCFQCHADKRGPFLWEHRSVQNDCTNCHNPHGTNNPPMLKVKMPFLCQQCHSTGHTRIDFDGNTLSGATGAQAQSRMIGRACTNCHSKVHGSNHPSGARLQR
jgi:DmsE family decaheme c-type cytochrome